MKFVNDCDFARQLDAEDPLGEFRQQFHIPSRNGETVVYLAGNSLGLQPVTARSYVEQEFLAWAQWGVDAHFQGEHPWYYYHHRSRQALASILGALPEEVVATGSLTSNLHFLLVTFYRPSGRRYKVLMEAQAFPSDQYAVETQVRFYGLDPNTAIVELTPRPGEACLRTEDICTQIQQHADSLALVFLGGVHYITGQFFDIATITSQGHSVGAMVGFDLAHAAGNVELRLHDWQVDFACWCSYKYLNSGPGGVGGMFVHERHGDDPTLPRFAGWWGYDEAQRFAMRKGFIPQRGAAGWQLSNAPVFALAMHQAALDLFERAGMKTLRTKSELLTAYLEFLICEYNELYPKKRLILITPANMHERGCQLSVMASKDGKELHQRLLDSSIICDWRPDPLGNGQGVIRMAPVPLYNRFEDVWRVGRVLAEYGQA